MRCIVCRSTIDMCAHGMTTTRLTRASAMFNAAFTPTRHRRLMSCSRIESGVSPLTATAHVVMDCLTTYIHSLCRAPAHSCPGIHPPVRSRNQQCEQTSQIPDSCSNPPAARFLRFPSHVAIAIVTFPSYPLASSPSHHSFTLVSGFAEQEASACARERS